MAVRHTVVVGGTRGIGLAFVNLLAKGGADERITVLGRRTTPTPWNDFGNLRYWPVDLLQPAALDYALAEIVEKQGPVNGLVFCQRYRDNDDPWNGELQTSLTATQYIIDALSDSFATGNKAIVIVTSIASRLIATEQSAGYHVAKAGLSQLARFYAVQLGSKGIRVNSIAPAIVLKDQARAFYAANPRLTDLYKRLTPLGRMGYASEIAEVILFLIGSGASFITGQEITVDGGVSIQWHESLARQLLDMTDINITRPEQNDERE